MAMLSKVRGLYHRERKSISAILNRPGFGGGSIS